MDAKIFENIGKSTDALRLKAKAARKKDLVVGVPLLVVGILLFILRLFCDALHEGVGGTVVFIFAIIFIVVGTIFLVMASFKLRNFRKTVLSALKAEVNRELYTDVQILDGSGFSLDMVLTPGFFARPDRFFSSGYVSGKRNGIFFEYSDFDLQKRHESTDSRGNTTVTYTSYSKGRMFHLRFEREFKQTLMVVERSMLGTPRGRGLKKVETEFLEFNKKFAVYCSDDQFVFYILTPQVQEKLLAMEKSNNGKFYFALIDDEIYLAIDNNGNFVVPSIDATMTPEEALRIASQFAMPAIIVDELSLDKSKYQKDAGTRV